MDDLSLGVGYFNAGRFTEALACFRAASAGPRAAQARVFTGHVASALGRGPEAAKAFISVIEDFPRHLPAYDGLANAILRGSPARDAASEKALLRALTLKPGADRAGLARTLRACAEALRSVGELVAAEKALSKALGLARDPAARHKLLDVLRMRSQACMAAGDLKGAEKELKKILALAPADEKARRALAGLLRRRGLAHVTSGRLGAAEKTLRRAVALNGSARKEKDAVRVLRLKAEEKRLKADRLREAEKARKLRRRVGALVTAGSLELAEKTLRGAGGAEGAAEYLAEVLRMRERAALARRQAAGRARALAHEVPNAPARLPQAILAWEEVLEADPSDGAAHLSLSLQLRWVGRRDEEEAVLRRAVETKVTLSPAGRFKALMRLGRYAEAARLGETILDGRVTLDDLRAFWDPWEKDNRPDREAPLADARSLALALKRTKGPWRRFYLGCLGEPGGFAALPSGRRYGWMHYGAAMDALFSGRFAQAVRSFNIALRRRPLDWRAHGYLAEAYACLDEPGLARRSMARAHAGASGPEKAQALAWRGELDLWLGDYERALERTTKSGSPFAHGWRGAALLKLGRREEALVQLDAALKLFPRDEEALLWRAEAKRELGRYREALDDLALVTRQHRVWIYFNRALANRALGDEAAMKADFDSLPPEVVAHVRRALGLGGAGPRDNEERARILEAGLVLARGFRRGEYAQAVWLSRREGREASRAASGGRNAGRRYG